MENKESCFSKIKSYLMAKFAKKDVVEEDVKTVEEQEPVRVEPVRESAVLRANTDRMPPHFYMDPLYTMNIGDPAAQMDMMARYDRMMIATGMYDPELDCDELY